MSNKGLFQKVKELKLQIGKYALFGSAPLGIRGLKDLKHDADVIVTEDLWDEFVLKDGWKLKKMTHGSKSSYLENENSDIQIWKDWYPGKWNIQSLIDEAEMIDELPFVKLEYVVEWKRMNGRDKDLKDIEIAEKFLRARKHNQ